MANPLGSGALFWLPHQSAPVSLPARPGPGKFNHRRYREHREYRYREPVSRFQIL